MTTGDQAVVRASGVGRVDGKVALVTGGGSGIGAATCAVLASEGAQVIVTDVNFEAARKLAEQIGEGSIAIKLDVASATSWMTVMTAVSRQFDRLDVLVNNAGVCLVGDIEDQSIEQYRAMNAVMNEGVFLGCKHAVSRMKKASGGSIVNISSIAALRGYPGFVGYTAAKGAVTALSKSVAVMCQDKGYKIRCNSVYPGDIETPMQEAFEGREGRPRKVAPGILAKAEVGAVEDIAAMVLFLASDESRFVTGAEFVVDNGAIARSGW